jgi:hypothetical protein
LVDDVGRSVEDDILVHKLPQDSVAATSKAGKRLDPIVLDHAMLPSHVIEAIFASCGRTINLGAETPERAGEWVKSGRCASALNGGIGLRLPEIVRVILFVDPLGNIG